MSGAFIAVAYFVTVGAAAGSFAGISGLSGERFGQRFLFGVGIVGLLAQLCGALRIPLGLRWYLTIFVASLATLAIRYPRRIPNARSEPPPTRWSRVAFAVAAVPILLLLIDNATLPLRDYDGRVFWILKAKAIAHEDSMTGPFFRGLSSRHAHTEYPLIMPVAAAAVFELTGSDDDRQIRWVYSFTAIAFLLTLRRLLASVGDPTIASWIVATVAWLPEFAASSDGGMISAYADVPMMAFTTLALVAWTDESRSNAELWRFPIALSFLPLVKNEGLVTAVILAVVAVALSARTRGAGDARRAAARTATALLVSVGALSLWRSMIPLEYDENYPLLFKSIGQNLHKLPEAFAALAGPALRFETWGLFWTLAAIAMIVALVTCRSTIAIACTASFMGILFVYTTTYAVTDWNLADLARVSANRLLLHLVPFAAVVMVSTASRASSERDKSA